MINWIKKQKIKSKTGFTLVESLVAIAILMISVSVPLQLATDSLLATAYSEQQFVAEYLAQDALEYIINIKTSNRLSHLPIDNNLDDCIDKKCIVDTTKGYSNAIESYTNGKTIGIDKETGIYKYFSSGQDDSDKKTIFSRYATIEELKNGDGDITQLKISVHVKWNNPKVGKKDYVLKTSISNW